MGSYVAILEDDARRISVMREELTRLLPHLEPIVFCDAAEMIRWLEAHVLECALISLDHDLLPPAGEEEGACDLGNGRQVADYLSGLIPTCAVIVHSANTVCAPGMFFQLNDAGWPCVRVSPYEDLEWIPILWAGAIRDMQARGMNFE